MIFVYAMSKNSIIDNQIDWLNSGYIKGYCETEQKKFDDLLDMKPKTKENEVSKLRTKKQRR